MASSVYEVEITFIGAWDLEDVISPRGTLSASAQVWAGPNHKCSTLADPVGGRFPPWCQTLTLRVLLPPGTPVEDAMLHVRVVHAVPEDGTELLIGSATLWLCHALGDNCGYSSGGRASEWSLQLWRPCGRPQGRVHVKLVVKEMRYWVPPSAYGVLPPPARRDYTAPPPPSYGQVENFGGMLTVFAAGAAAGWLTGLALAKGSHCLVDKITDMGKKLKGLFASGDVAEAAAEEGAGVASNDDAEATEDEDAGDASDLTFEEPLTSDDDSEAAEDRDAGDAYNLAFEELLDSDDDSENEDAEDASEDEDDPAPEIIDLAYPDDGGGGGGGGCGDGDGGVGDGDN